MNRMRDDTGSIVAGGLLRTVLWLLVAVVVVWDLVGMAVNRVQLDDIGGRAAADASRVWEAGGGPPAAEQAVRDRLAGEDGVTLEAFTIVGTENHTGRLTLAVSRRARGFVAHRIGALDSWTEPVVEKERTLVR